MKVMDKEILLNDHNRPDGHHGHLVCTWIKQNNDKNFFAKKHFSCLLPFWNVFCQTKTIGFHSVQI